MLENSDFNFDPIAKYGGVGKPLDYRSDYLVVMQHPVTTEYTESRTHVNETLEAIRELNIPTFWFWPNVDAGSDGTSGAIRTFRERNPNTNIHFFKNMEPQDFLRLLINSRCLIGNSSVGIRECAFLGVPVVNIGSRQTRRDRGHNVIDVEYKKEAIMEAIDTWFSNGKAAQSDIYGGGEAGIRIAQLLSEVSIKFHKTIVY